MQKANAEDMLDSDTVQPGGPGIPSLNRASTAKQLSRARHVVDICYFRVIQKSLVDTARLDRCHILSNG